MAKINLSIPDELKEQMDTLPGRQWSQVATRAFEIYVRQHKVTGANMSEAIERLRASREKVAGEDHANGVELGKKWAMERAEWDELRAVASLEECKRDSVNFFAFMENIGFDDEGVLALFHRDVDDPPISDEMVAGFVEGAELVHDQV
jgi:hypothetical protein